MKFVFLLGLLISQSVFSGQIRVMSYNVENLFDNTHDEGKADFQYLPFSSTIKDEGCRATNRSGYRLKECLRTDWRMDRLNLKISQITDAITCSKITYNEDGSFAEKICNRTLPDVLVLTEVENLNVLKMLKESLGYQSAVIAEQGSDRRGINVAFLYTERADMQFVGWDEYEINSFIRSTKDPILKDLKDILVSRNEFLMTRSIVELAFNVNGEVIHIFGNHWPSQSPSHHYLERPAFAKMLLKAVSDRLAENSEAMFLMLGDFNVLDGDKSPHAMFDILLNENVGGMINTLDVYNDFYADVSTLPPGSHYYQRGGSWSFLDKIIASPNLFNKTEGLVIDYSFQDFYNVINFDFMTFGNIRRPNRYNFSATDASHAGYSDHFPMEVILRY